MKKLFHILPLFAALIFLASCSEKDEVGEYDNWQARNQHYVDSIASLADAGRDGWTKIIAYNLNTREPRPDLNNNYYIYVQKLEKELVTNFPKITTPFVFTTWDVSFLPCHTRRVMSSTRVTALTRSTRRLTCPS